MQNRSRLWRAAGLVAPIVTFLGIGVANADPYTIEAAPLYTVAGASPTAYEVPAGTRSGVGDLIISRPDGTFRCTGSLVGGGGYLLTAAHCVTDAQGALSTSTTAFVDFSTSTAVERHDISAITVHSSWKGDVLRGSDIAILKLATAASANVDSYNIYRGTDELGKVADKVGYGMTGTGATGATQASGTKHEGQNVYDAIGSEMPKSWRMGNGQLLYDFDDGTAAHDGFGTFFGRVDLGLGDTEVMSAPGDSGGPTFIDGLIAGITSFGFTLGGSDIDSVLNSSFGEFGGDTRVSFYADWIDAVLAGNSPPTGGGGGKGGGGGGKGGGPKRVDGLDFAAAEVQVPEAPTLALVVFGLGVVAFMRRRRGP